MHCISLCPFGLELVDSKEEFLPVLVHPDTKGFPVSSPLLKNNPASTRMLIHSSLEEQWTSISRHCEEYSLVQMIAFAYQNAAGQGQSCYTLAELLHPWEMLRAIKWPGIQLKVPSLTIPHPGRWLTWQSVPRFESKLFLCSLCRMSVQHVPCTHVSCLPSSNSQSSRITKLLLTC